MDGRPDLGLIVYNPATPADRTLVETLLAVKQASAAE